MNEESQTAEMTREDALEVIEMLRQEYGDHAEKLHEANEAKTRLLIIDRVLNVLGWSRDDFNPEASAGDIGYIDYMLTIDDTPRVVVEAKRIGHTFGSPSHGMRKTDYQLNYLRKAFGPALNEVLEQAIEYAEANSVPFAILTNGVQWMLVQVIPHPGKRKVDELRGFYFGDLFSTNFNFELFWELLYCPYVEAGHLTEHFAQLNLEEVDFCAIPRDQTGDIQWRKPRNNQHLTDFYHLFFSEIIDEARRKMLEKCFVSNTQLDHYQGEIKRALKDTPPRFIPDAINISPDAREEFLASETGDKKGRVILVTGSVGCGKSTLVQKVLVEARQERDLICLVLNLIDEVANEPENIEAILWKYLSRAWKKEKPESYHREQLEKIFGRELSELRKGPYEKVYESNEERLAQDKAELLATLSSDPEEFFPKCWRYYRNKNNGIAVFLDNVDRTSEHFQRQVYAFAHKLARNTGATVIITMREVTFFRGREGGFLDVRSSDTVFHLKTPNLESLLAKRIRYVLEDIDQDHRVKKWRRSQEWDLFRGSMMEHANALKRTFLLSETGREVLSLLAAVAWHDVRYFLRLLQRAHTMLGSRDEPWTTPELIATLMTPADVASKPSVLSNIYRPSYATYPCYFLKIRILLILFYGMPHHQTRYGISLSRILRLVRSYGYRARWAQRAIEEMVRERILECVEAPAEEEYTKEYKLSDRHTFRPSPMAALMIEKIAFEGIYLCLIGNDLPFHKQVAFKRYQAALENVSELLDDRQLERAAVDLVTETQLGRIVAQYLVESFANEKPAPNLKRTIPEIASAEEQLSHIIDRLGEFGKVSIVSNEVQEESVPQLPLFDFDTYQKTHRLYDKLPIPENITKVRIGRSTLGPLIFWALVVSSKRGHSHISAREATELINNYLVDDHNQKHESSILRALSSKTLQAQEWLRTEVDPKSGRKFFGLKGDWRTHWESIFDETAPTFD